MKVTTDKELSEDLFTLLDNFDLTGFRRFSEDKSKDWSDDLFRRFSEDKLSSDHHLTNPL
jgi:hypothetical protein